LSSNGANHLPTCSGFVNTSKTSFDRSFEVSGEENFEGIRKLDAGRSMTIKVSLELSVLEYFDVSVIAFIPFAVVTEVDVHSSSRSFQDCSYFSNQSWRGRRCSGSNRLEASSSVRAALDQADFAQHPQWF